MPAHEDVVALVVQRHHLPALQLGLRGEERAHEVRHEQAEGRGEAVQDELRGVRRGVAVAGEAVSVDPVGDAEVEGGAVGEVDDCEACGLFQVFFEDDDGGVFAAGGCEG